MTDITALGAALDALGVARVDLDFDEALLSENEAKTMTTLKLLGAQLLLVLAKNHAPARMSLMALAVAVSAALDSFEPEEKDEAFVAFLRAVRASGSFWPTKVLVP